MFDVRNPQQRIEFGEFCAAARRERIDLGARGFYATPGVDFNRETGRGNPFFYFTQGAAVAEVKIDRFTGELIVPRVDLLMDIGRSINPGVDLGQIIGGFIQGMGWVTGECLVYNERGELLSHSPTTYKIPAITDVPPIFNCDCSPTTTTWKTSAQQSRRRTAADARHVRLDGGEACVGLRFAQRRPRTPLAGDWRGDSALPDAGARRKSSMPTSHPLSSLNTFSRWLVISGLVDEAAFTDLWNELNQMVSIIKSSAMNSLLSSLLSLEKML